MPKVDFRDGHRFSLCCRFSLIVHLINEHAHPLIPCAMRIYGATAFASRFNFNALIAGLHSVVGIHTPNN